MTDNNTHDLQTFQQNEVENAVNNNSKHHRAIIRPAFCCLKNNHSKNLTCFQLQANDLDGSRTRARFVRGLGDNGNLIFGERACPARSPSWRADTRHNELLL
jgi:hypothetical protein